VLPPAPTLLDIGLDLPPTGAALRRSVAAGPPPAYDMGSVVPLHANTSALMVRRSDLMICRQLRTQRTSALHGTH
jgi:hypothetical protein